MPYLVPDTLPLLNESRTRPRYHPAAFARNLRKARASISTRSVTSPMKVRELRNNLVFWGALACFVYLFRSQLGYGWLMSCCGAVGLAIVAVLVVALATDLMIG